MVAAMLNANILQETNNYKILGVDEKSSLEDINKIYKTLAKQFHPDMFVANSPQEKDKANAIFAKVTSAYNVLKDTEKRKNHDYELMLKREYEKTIELANKNFAGPGVVEKSTARPSNGFKLNVAIDYSKTYNYDNAKTSSSTSPANPVQQQNNTPAQNQQKKESSPEAQEAKNAQADTLYNSALEKYQKKNIDAAILDLQTASVMAPKISKYHSALGLMMKEKGWHSYAQAEFKKALALNPKDPIAIKYMEEYESQNQDKNKTSKTPSLNKSDKKGFIARILEILFGVFKKA